MIEVDGERFRLTIPLSEAVSFAMGWTDLSYDQPADVLRQLIGLVALDTLQYSEQWRAAAIVRACFKEKWPELRW
jgi:hypothetical protein